jgi:hypothetical protein
LCVVSIAAAAAESAALFTAARLSATRVARCRSDVTVTAASSHGVTYASECCVRSSTGHVGLPDPTLASSFPSSPSWFSSDRRPPKLSLWVHPLARFPSPTEFLASLPARRLPAPSTFLGVSCPIAAQPAESTYTVPSFHQAPRRGHPKPTSFRPRRFSRPRRLPPPLTLRVCFTPQPRPGFALQGFLLG